MLPNFLLIGSAKSATTTFAADLAGCDDMVVPDVKEPHFLTHDWSADVMKARYDELYAGSAAKFMVDASTGYSKRDEFPGVPQRARDLLGSETQIVYLVRDPVQRAISHHFHLMRRSKISHDFSLACEQDPGIIESSRYFYQLQPWLECFDRSNIHVFVMEEYVRDRLRIVNELLDKVGASTLRETDFDESAKNVGDSNNSTRFGLGPLVFRIMTSRAYGKFSRMPLAAIVRTKLKSLLITSADRPEKPSPAQLRPLLESCEQDWQDFVQWFGRQPESWTFCEGCALAPSSSE